MTISKDSEDEDRRKFLAACGRFTAVIPPKTTVLFSTSLNSDAVAFSGGGNIQGSKQPSLKQQSPEPKQSISTAAAIPPGARNIRDLQRRLSLIRDIERQLEARINALAIERRQITATRRA